MRHLIVWTLSYHLPINEISMLSHFTTRNNRAALPGAQCNLSAKYDLPDGLLTVTGTQLVNGPCLLGSDSPEAL